MGAAPPKLHPLLLGQVVECLFPQRPVRQWSREEDDAAGSVFEEVKVEEVAMIARKISTNKAPGPDGVPAEGVKILPMTKPEVFADMANNLLRRARFPRVWKTARLVLIPKPGKPPEQPSAKPSRRSYLAGW